MRVPAEGAFGVRIRYFLHSWGYFEQNISLERKTSIICSTLYFCPLIEKECRLPVPSFIPPGAQTSLINHVVVRNIALSTPPNHMHSIFL
jgi:hypothetical protein